MQVSLPEFAQSSHRVRHRQRRLKVLESVVHLLNRHRLLFPVLCQLLFIIRKGYVVNRVQKRLRSNKYFQQRFLVSVRKHVISYLFLNILRIQLLPLSNLSFNCFNTVKQNVFQLASFDLIVTLQHFKFSCKFLHTLIVGFANLFYHTFFIILNLHLLTILHFLFF